MDKNKKIIIAVICVIVIAVAVILIVNGGKPNQEALTKAYNDAKAELANLAADATDEVKAAAQKKVDDAKAALEKAFPDALKALESVEAAGKEVVNNLVNNEPTVEATEAPADGSVE